MGQAAIACSHRVEVADRPAACPLHFSAVDFRSNSPDDLLGHLVLQIENVLHQAVKPIRPEVRAGRDIDELPADPQAIACRSYTAFEHVAYAKLVPNLLDVDGFAFVDK